MCREHSGFLPDTTYMVDIQYQLTDNWLLQVWCGSWCEHTLWPSCPKLLRTTNLSWTTRSSTGSTTRWEWPCWISVQLMVTVASYIGSNGQMFEWWHVQVNERFFGDGCVHFITYAHTHTRTHTHTHTHRTPHHTHTNLMSGYNVTRLLAWSCDAGLPATHYFCRSDWRHTGKATHYFYRSLWKHTDKATH